MEHSVNGRLKQKLFTSLEEGFGVVLQLNDTSPKVLGRAIYQVCPNYSTL